MKSAGTCQAGIVAVTVVCIFSTVLQAQVNITTYHNDNARTAQNTQETILTPANVNSSQFGKVFSASVDGWVYAQPLYLSNVHIAGGTHNVLYVATEHDSLYAIDADQGAIYWQISLIPSAGSTVNSSGDLVCSDLVPEVGITGTPVIDTGTGTIYLVAKSKVNGSLVQYLHAIDVVTSAEKFGGPVFIQATVPGTASDGNGTTVSFSPHFENQRPGLLLENGHVVIGWSSHCDNTPWHGWIMSYSASTLAQEAAFNTSADGSGNGVWMSGGGLAADSNGNIFFATGNGTWNGTTDYGDSIVKLGPPSGGSFPVLDYFTPYNQSSLGGGDTDVGSGGLVLLPNLPSGQQLLTQMGKEGTMYVVDRNNMGKYCVNDVPACAGNDPNIVEEIPGATAGIWSTPAYWNGTVYWGGGSYAHPDNLMAFSFNANNSGQISASPTSETSKAFSFVPPSPSISANGNSNGILWGLDNSAFKSTCSGGSNCQVLYAYDATNLATMLYNSSQAANNRDVPGGAVKYTTPIIANGKVYIGSQFAVSGYGAITTTPTAATPTFNPAPGGYSAAQSVTLSDTTGGAVIHCTTDGITTPTASSPVCTTVQVSATTTIQAIAVANGYNNSAVASGTYTISTTGPYGSGFSSTGLALNGSAKLNGTRLRVTDGGTSEAGSGFYTTPLNIQSFSTAFSIQLTNPNADGMAFVIQNAGTTALGADGGGLGYGATTYGGSGGIPSSVAVKFDLYNDGGEGSNSIGLYTGGAMPSVPATTLGGNVNLHSGDVFNVSISYNGTTLTMTITDASNSSETFTVSWPINIPGTVGSNTAYMGFTGGTGGLSAIQDILNWTYATTGQPTAATPTFNPAPGSYSAAQSVTLSDTTGGAVIHCTTDGITTPTASSPVCTTVQVSATTTIQAIAVASGYNNSAVASGTYTITTTPTAATPTFNPAPGSYSAAQSVTLSDTTGGAVIHCTTDGITTPTASSPVCTTVQVSATTTIQAIAVASGYNNSAVASGTYTISTTGPYGSGFSSTGLALNGSAKLNGTRLRVTDGGTSEAGSGFYTTPLNIQSFSTAFSLQLTNPNADGMAFVIQNAGTTALGADGGGLGYGATTYGGSGGIPSSVAVKFDLYNDGGEGPNSVGLYTGGAMPSVPATTLGGNVNLHSGDVFNVSISYNGTTLTMTITDASNSSETFTVSWPINIPGTVGSNTAYMGFTGGTGGLSAIQDILNWTYATTGQPTAATPTFNPAPGSYSAAQSVTLSDTTGGAVIHCTTDGITTPTASSPVCTTVQVSATTTIQAIAVASGYNNSAVASGTYTITTTPTAATPTFSPAPGSYSAAQSVTLSDTTGGAVIHCTTDGITTPTASSPVCTTVQVSATTTIQAIAVASGYNNSAVASGTYTITTTPTAATPTFNPAPGSYSAAQSVTLSDTTGGAVIHCTTDGITTPTASSPVCTTVQVSATTTIQAIAVASGYNNSAVASGTYTISTTGPYGSGFSATGLALNGSAKLNGTRLRVTDGGTSEAGSGFYTTPLNIQSFSTAFSLQLTNPNADGMAFVIQNAGTTALGADGGGLGYGATTYGGSGGIPSSVAVKFDLYNDGGEGPNSVGLYTGGAMPSVPATTLGGNVNLHSGDVFNVSISYNGTTLTMTITDASNSSETFTVSWPINIPGTVGSNTAYMGFTGGTGGLSAIQDILNWTYATTGQPTAATPTFNPAPGSYSAAQSVTLSDTTGGAVIHCTTDGITTPTASSPVCTTVQVSATTTIQAIAVASGYNNSAVASGTYTITTTPTAATPTFNPAPGSYSAAQSVTLSDTTGGAVIHCTTDGITTPTASSPVCTTVQVSATTTIQAIAVASGYNNSAVASGTYTITTTPTAATPTFNPAPGSYSAAQSVTLSDTTGGAVIHCTTDGITTPTASSPVCTTVQVSATTTIQAIAVASGYNNSAVTSGTYTISTTGPYGSGFSSTGLALNGSAKLNGTRLRVTDGGTSEAGSGFYTTPLNIQSFSTAFSLQLTNPNADGMAFVIQNAGTTALGADGGGLGYGATTYGGSGGIPSSVAVKFDLYNDGGEGPNSVGLYTGGAMPSVPATTLGGNVNLHSGDVFNVSISYNGTTLTMTITDASNSSETFTVSWPINIPGTVGSNTAYMGFTGGTGGLSAIQDILNWTYATTGQ